MTSEDRKVNSTTFQVSTTCTNPVTDHTDHTQYHLVLKRQTPYIFRSTYQRFNTRKIPRLKTKKN